MNNGNYGRLSKEKGGYSLWWLYLGSGRQKKFGEESWDKQSQDSSRMSFFYMALGRHHISRFLLHPAVRLFTWHRHFITLYFIILSFCENYMLISQLYTLVPPSEET